MSERLVLSLPGLDVALRQIRGCEPCKRHDWMTEQQTGHSYCHVCGVHRKRQRVAASTAVGRDVR